MDPMVELIESGARSAAERLAVTILDDADIDGWIANHPCCGYEIDFAFVDPHGDQRRRMTADVAKGVADHDDTRHL